MMIYFAPMEGITGYIYRRAPARIFNQIDKYFTPFIAANQYGSFSSKELNDVLPAHNAGVHVVPQILTNNAADFLLSAKQLKDFGYEEINLNLGCPSGTVVAKNKGSGFLALPDALDRFLDQVYEEVDMKLSIKTRLGKESPAEFYRLLEIYNQYPVEELIIHPRVQKDFYKNTPHWDLFLEARRLSKHRICYNGDLFTSQHIEAFREVFPDLNEVMIGRGLLINPALGSGEANHQVIKGAIRQFHDEIYLGYQEIMSGERNVRFKMKELWFYMSHTFSNFEKYAKRIKKAQHLRDYEEAVTQLFDEQEIIPPYRNI